MKQRKTFTLLLFALFSFFTAYQTKACDTPTGIAVSLNAGLSIHVQWNAVSGADSYNFQIYHEESPENGSVYNTTTNSFDFTLIFCGYYNVDVQAVCGGTPSAWATLNFESPTTMCSDAPDCDAMTTFTETYNSGTNAYDLSWPAMTNNLYFIRFKPSSGGTWGPTTNISGNTFSSTIQNCADYDYQVQHICGPGFYSEFSATQTYSPHTAPGGLFESDLTKSSVKLNWTAVSGATYAVQYRRVGQGWATETPTTNYLTLNTLMKNKTYEWKVAAVCGGVTGPYSAVRTFTTPNNKSDFESFEDFSASIQLFPNPANTQATLQIAVSTETTAQVLVMDVTGKLISKVQLNLAEGSQDINIDLADFENGIYMVSVALESGEKLIKKLVVVH